jgi:hypothetical protein
MHHFDVEIAAFAPILKKKLTCESMHTRSVHNNASQIVMEGDNVARAQGHFSQDCEGAAPVLTERKM